MFKAILAIAISLIMGGIAVTQLNLTGAAANFGPISSPISSPVTPSPTPTLSPITSPVIHTPVISWMFPHFGNTESLITVFGSGFGYRRGQVIFLTPSHTEYGASIKYWGDNLIQFYVPFILLSNQTNQIVVENYAGVYSNAMSYHISQGEPYLESILPQHTIPGGVITLTGEGFGRVRGQVNFYDAKQHLTHGSIQSWKDTQIVVKLPSTLKVSTEYGLQIVSAGHTHSSLTFYTTGEGSTPTPTPTTSPTPAPTVTPVPTNNDTQAGSQNADPISASACNDTKPGSAPVLLSAKVTGNNEVTLQWIEAQSPVSYYLVAYGYSADQMLFGNPNIGGNGTTSYRVSGLSGGLTYYFKVRAGDGCMPGDFSNSLSVSVPGSKLITQASNFQPGVLGAHTSVDNSDEASPSPSASSNNSSLLVTPHNDVPKTVEEANIFVRLWHFITHLFGH